VNTAQAVVADLRECDFRRLAPSIGLKPDDLNRFFRNNGMVYQIVGIDLLCERRPVLCVRKMDKLRARFPVSIIKAGLFQWTGFEH